MKRALGKLGDRPVSPPPAKRKVESTTTKKAVSTFFTPASQKQPAKTNWRIVNNTLLVGRHDGAQGVESKPRRKIAAFDFDSTLIRTSSGNVFGKGPMDWKWWHPSVPTKLKSLYADGYLVVVISNQGGISLKNDSKSLKNDQKRLSDFKTKVGYVLDQLDIPISVYAATAKDQYRKPRIGMWKEMMEDYDLDVGNGIDSVQSLFVGDAAGRLARKDAKADHSSSDRDFAANVGIPFQTPEEYFLNEDPLPYVRTFEPSNYIDDQDSSATQLPLIKKVNPVDVVLFCGSPGAGKSTFYWTWLKPLGYERVNQDILKSRDRCVKVATEYLEAQKPVVIDNTNADPEVRRIWVELAAKMKVPIRCVRFRTPPEACKHNDYVRALNPTLNPEKRTMLPGIAFSGFSSRYREPKLEEGFQDIVDVAFRFRGTDDQKNIWSQYW